MPSLNPGPRPSRASRHLPPPSSLSEPLGVTLGKLFTPLRPCHWSICQEGNRWSGIAMTIHWRLQWFNHPRGSRPTIESWSLMKYCTLCTLFFSHGDHWSQHPVTEKKCIKWNIGAIVDIRQRPRCAIPAPTSRPVIDSCNACNQASAPVVCTMHTAVWTGPIRHYYGC